MIASCIASYRDMLCKHDPLIAFGILFTFTVYPVKYIGLLFMLLGWGLVLKNEGRKVFQSPLTRPFVVLNIVAALSFLYVHAYSHAFSMLGTILEITVSFWISLYFFKNRDHEEHKIFVVALFVGALIVGVYGIYQFRFLGVRRAYSLVRNPNLLGVYMLFVFALALGMVYAPGRWMRRLAAVVLVVSGTNILYSLSRASLIGALFAILFMGLFRDRRLLIVLLILVLLYPLLLSQPLFSRFYDLREVLVSGGRTARHDVWRRAWGMFRESPIVGQGVGQYRYFYRHSHAHNLFLQTASELGIIGLLILLWILYNLAQFIRANLHAISGFRGYLAHGLTAALFGFFFQEQFDFCLIDDGGVTILAGILTGWLVALLSDVHRGRFACREVSDGPDAPG